MHEYLRRDAHRMVVVVHPRQQGEEQLLRELATTRIVLGALPQLERHVRSNDVDRGRYLVVGVHLREACQQLGVDQLDVPQQHVDGKQLNVVAHVAKVLELHDLPHHRVDRVHGSRGAERLAGQHAQRLPHVDLGAVGARHGRELALRELGIVQVEAQQLEQQPLGEASIGLDREVEPLEERQQDDARLEHRRAPRVHVGGAVDLAEFIIGRRAGGSSCASTAAAHVAIKGAGGIEAERHDLGHHPLGDGNVERPHASAQVLEQAHGNAQRASCQLSKLHQRCLGRVLQLGRQLASCQQLKRLGRQTQRHEAAQRRDAAVVAVVEASPCREHHVAKVLDRDGQQAVQAVQCRLVGLGGVARSRER